MGSQPQLAKPEDAKERIARRVAQEMRDGYYANLGVGIPVMVANYIPDGMEVVLEAENGMLGIGPYPFEDQVDPDLVNAGKEPVTEIPGTSYFHSADSFTMIRGGHVDITVLGGMEVDEHGNLANWTVPGKKLQGMGGAMDLVAGSPARHHRHGTHNQRREAENPQAMRSAAHRCRSRGSDRN